MPIIVVGPYALWTVPADRAKGLPPVEGNYGEYLFEEALDFVEGLPPVERDGRPHRRFCYVPRGKRDGGPRWLVGGVVPPVAGEVIDFQAVQPGAEIAAFAAAYAAELAELARLFGGPPEIGWGWVGWDPGW